MKHFSELTTEQCVELLNTGQVGRVGLVIPVGVRIVPVNYAIYRDDIVWRTAPYTELGTYGDGSNIVFEVDHLDYANHWAWSVIAEGTCWIVQDPDEVADIRRIEDPAPWSAGLRSLYMRLKWRRISGRRVGEAGDLSDLQGFSEPLEPTSYR